MSVREQLNRAGNMNRIMEMHEGGCGPNQIAGAFMDHGIQITATQVINVVETYEALGAKALPKAVAKAAIRANKNTFNNVLTMQPA